MTLVLTALTAGRITMVADTMFSTPHHVTKTREELLTCPGLKIVIVSPRLAVAMAGNMRVESVYQAVYEHWSDSAALKAMLTARSERGEAFIVAELDPVPALTRIRSGVPERVTGAGRLEIGDAVSYELYRRREALCKHPESVPYGDLAQEMRAALQWFLNVDAGAQKRSRVELERPRAFTADAEADFERTIGGYLTEITTTATGFAYAPYTQWTLPDRMAATLFRGPNGAVNLKAMSSEHTNHFRYSLAGTPNAPRAAGFCLPEARTGVYFRDGKPWAPKVLAGIDSVQDMIEWTRDWLGRATLRAHVSFDYACGHLEMAAAQGQSA